MCWFSKSPATPGRLRARILELLARLVTPMHPTNASGNNMSQR